MERQIIASTSKDTSHDGVIMLNAWVQTESSWVQQSNREKTLQRRIDELETQLNTVNELARNIIVNSDTGELKPNNQRKYSQIQYNHIMKNNSNTTINDNYISNETSVINPVTVASVMANESIKYKIIPEGTDDVNIEPIDIRLESSSDDISTDNLNCSDNESGRLVICVPNVFDDGQQEKKSNIEHMDNNSTYITNQQTLFEKKISPDSSTNLRENSLRTISTIYNHNDDSISYNNDTHGTPESKSATTENSRLIFNHDGHISSVPCIRVTVPALQPHHEINTINEQKCIDKSTSLPTLTVTQMQYSQQQQEYKHQNEQLEGPINYSYSSNVMTINSSKANNNDYNTPDNSNKKDGIMVTIGKYGSRVTKQDYEKINWNFPAQAIRKLLMSAFGRETLATHSLTGRPSPAFKGQNKPIKQKLNKLIIEDIIELVMQKSSISRKEIRSIITTKCADENKMMKLRLHKRTPMRELNVQNLKTDDDNNKN